MTFSNKIILLFLLLVIMSLISCATTSNRHREGDNTGQETEITVEDEKKMTEEVLPKMREDYPPVKDQKLQKYITELGNKLTQASNLEGNPYNYNFTVVDVDYVNAFALPAGTVFVTMPLIEMTENEAELAGVIGHEIGHVQARHTAERMDKAKGATGRSILYTVGGGIVGAAAGLGTGALICNKGDFSCYAKATSAGAAIGAGGSLLIQKYTFMKNSREDELEADRIGFRVATKAGYSSEHVGKFYEKLLQIEKEQKKKKSNILAALSDAMSTHPPSEERVKQMNEMAVAHSKKENPVVNSSEFISAKARSAYLLSKRRRDK